MTNSREKGKRGEREWALVMSAAGWPSRRGQQFKGGEDSPDVITPSLEGWFHAEVKRDERLNVEKALAQAEEEAPAGSLPYVAHRKNGEGWKVTMRAEDWFLMLDKYME